MNCEQVREKLTGHCLGDLDAPTAAEVESHLTRCAGCRAVLREIQPTLELLQAALAATSVSGARLSAERRAQVVRHQAGSVPRTWRWVTSSHPVLARAAGLLFVAGLVVVAMFGMLGDTIRGKLSGAVHEMDSGADLAFEVVADGESQFKTEGNQGVEGDRNGKGLYKRKSSAAPAVRMPAGATGGLRPVNSPEDAINRKSADWLKESSQSAEEQVATRPDTTVASGSSGEAAQKDDSNGDGLPTAKQQPYSPAPAMFDTVAIVTSPLKMKGVYGSRTPAGRQEALAKYGADSDLEIRIENANEVKEEMPSAAAQPLPPPAPPAAKPAETRAKQAGTMGAGGAGRGSHMDTSILRVAQAEKEPDLPADARVAELGDRARVEPSRSTAKLPATPAEPGAATAVNGAMRRNGGTIAGESDEGAATARIRMSHEKESTVTVGGMIERKAAPASGWASDREVLGKDLPSPVLRAGQNADLKEGDKLRVLDGQEQQSAESAGARVQPLPREGPLSGAMVTLSGSASEKRLKEENSRAPIADAPVSQVAAIKSDRLSTEKKLEAVSAVVADDGGVADNESKKRKLAESDAKPVLSADKAAATQSEEELTGPRFKAVGVNPMVSAVGQAFSTFAIDVDSASYTLSRNYMLQGYLPPAEAVRTEEFVNFFDYGYRPPDQGVFAVYSELAPSRFGRGLNLLKIGVKGRRLGREEQRQAVLTFLIDTSGSMAKADRLPLVRKALRMLVEKLGDQDTVAIVQYDSHARLVLEPTAASDKARILAVIDGLLSGGSTNLEEGMQRAYEVAARSFVPGGENRVLLLSDGVANLGALAAGDILSKVETHRKQGILCSVIGFGTGNYDDTMLEALANKGDGSYSFVDSEQEARRVFVDDLAATLNTIAKDVKIQVEFNPRLVKQYRQMGYENRQLKKEDFRNDAVDAGEVGSGQSVTALYELELVEKDAAVAADAVASTMPADTIAMVRVRYCRTDNGMVEEIATPVKLAQVAAGFEAASVRFRLAACVAEFAEILRASPFAAGSECRDIAEALRPVALELNLDGSIQELLRMVEGAGGLSRGK